MRYPKRAIQTFALISLGGPLLVGLAIIALLMVTHPNDRLTLLIFLKGAGATLLFTYAAGLVPALVAALFVAVLVFQKGRLAWPWVLLIGFVSGSVGMFLIYFPYKGFSGLNNALDVGSLLGFLGLFASLLLLPFLWCMKIVSKGEA